MARTRAHVRTALQEEREQLLAGLAHEDAAPSGSADVADLATARIEQSADDRERQRRQDRIVQIDAALQRLDEGTWGQCESCGKKIAAARMEALPTARFCVTCAAKQR